MKSTSITTTICKSTMSEVNEDLIITKHSDLYTGAEFLCNALSQSGVTHVYGGHGGAVVALIDAIVAHPSLTWVYCRCEVNASQMAAAHAKLHGTLGCCIATSGPGAAHLLSGLVDADQDRCALLCITGLKSSDHVRYADFQDIDQASIFRMAGLAFSETVSDVGQLLPLTRNAFTVAISSNRCAHLAIPINIQQKFVKARTHFCLGTTYQILQGVPATKVQLDALVMALRTEIDSNRNVLITCGYRANGLGRHIERLAELLHAPILTSFDGKGTVDENHPLSFGVVGVYGNAGTYSAVDLLEQCETVIGIGVNDWSELATDSSGLQVRRIIQIDDRLVAGDSMRFAPSAVLSCGYLAESLDQVNKLLEEHMRPLTRYGHRLTGTADFDLGAILTHEPKSEKYTWSELKKENYRKPVGTPSTFLLIERLVDSPEVKSETHCHPAIFFNVMARHLDNSSIICSDIGDNALFMAASLAAQRGQRFLTSEHLGIMGYSINSAIAASLSTQGSEKTLAVAGDGAIQMSINELATMRDHGAKNVLVVVVVNSRLGRVQNESWGPGLNADGCHIGSPDYVKLFEAYGYPEGQVLSTCDKEAIGDAIEKGWKLAANHGCSVIVVEQDPQVHPIMHKLESKQALHENPFATNESVLPSIKLGIREESKTQIKEWLDKLSQVEVSDWYWLNRGDLFSTSLASVVERLFGSLSINDNELFTSSEARSSFDTEFKAAFLNAMPPKAIVEEIASKGISNGHPLKIQFLCCPPNFNFKLHSHPNVELNVPLVGELGERRLMEASLNPKVLAKSTVLPASDDEDKYYKAPSDEEMKESKELLQTTLEERVKSLGSTGEFEDRVLHAGRFLFNDVGSVHQSYTLPTSGCLLLVLWSGMHADLDHCDCCGIKGNENLFVPNSVRK